MRRKLMILIPIVLLVLAAAGVAGTWLWAARALESGYTAWLQERRAEGYRFENAAAEFGGFPFKLTARLPDPAVAAPQGWRWQAPEVHARADVLAPFTVRFTAPGRHRLTTTEGRELVADAETARGRVLFRRDGDGAHSGQMTLENVALSGLAAGPSSAEALFLALGPQRRPANAPAELDAVLEADGLQLPPGAETPFGRTISHLRARGTAVGAPPRRLDAAALQDWRARGGRIVLDHLEIDWDPFEVSGSGELTLDEQLRPQGKLSVAIRGLGAALDRLARAGLVNERAVAYAKIAISALGSRDEATGQSRIELPVSFRNGRFYLGPVPLLPLRPVV